MYNQICLQLIELVFRKKFDKKRCCQAGRVSLVMSGLNVILIAVADLD